MWTRSPKSGRFVRANGIAPAARIRSTVGASIDATASASALTPCVVGVPGDVDVLLDRARHAVQPTEFVAGGNRRVGGVRGGPRLVVE